MKKNIYIRLSFFLIIYSSVAFSQQQWKKCNGPYLGGLYDITIAPSKTIFTANNNGIYRSTDNGKSWYLTNSPLYKKSLVSNSNGFIYAGTSSSRIYVSSDDGITWINCSDGFNGSSVNTLVNDNNGTVYAGGDGGLYKTITPTSWIKLCDRNVYSILIHPSGDIIIGTNYDGIFRSSDNGISWLEIKNGLPFDGIYSLAIDSNGYLFAGTFSNGIYRSTDNGNNWVKSSSGLEGSNICDILVSEGVIFAATQDATFKSNDDGINWIKVVDLPNAWASAIVKDSTRGLYIATDLGIYHSSDNGNNWTQLNSSLTNTLVNSVAVYSNFIFAGNDNDGIFRSTDNGENWFNFSSGISDKNIKKIIYNPSNRTLFCSTDNNFYKSTNDGVSWSPVNAIFMGEKILGIALDSAGCLYAGTHSSKLIYSDPQGVVWAKTTDAPYPIYAVGVSSNGYIFVGSDVPGGIYRSTDKGLNWHEVNNGIQGREGRVRTIFIDKRDWIFVGTADSGMFRSTDYGNSWITINRNINDKTILTVTGNALNHIFAGTYYGDIYQSVNGGESWQLINYGMTTRPVRSLAINEMGHIYAGVCGPSYLACGVFRSLSSTTTEVVDNFSILSKAYYLEQNYPNPFNSATKINFEIPNLSHVKLTVYDILGREIIMFVNEELRPGRYEFIWYASKYASGVYFYKIKAGAYVETKKMLLIR